MKKEFEIIFKPKYYDEIVEDFDNGNLGYNPWTKIDIIIKGKSFFEKIISDSANNLNGGFGGPLYNLADELIQLPEKIINKKLALFTDPELQIENVLIFKYKDNTVTFAMIKDNYWYDNEDEWYQGENWVYSSSNIVPKSHFNTIDFQIFKKGCYESIVILLKGLKEKYPKITNTHGYKLLREDLKKQI